MNAIYCVYENKKMRMRMRTLLIPAGNSKFIGASQKVEYSSKSIKNNKKLKIYINIFSTKL